MKEDLEKFRDTFANEDRARNRADSWTVFWRDLDLPDEANACAIRSCMDCDGPLTVLVSREVPELALMCPACKHMCALFMLVRGDEQ